MEKGVEVSAKDMQSYGNLTPLMDSMQHPSFLSIRARARLSLPHHGGRRSQLSSLSPSVGHVDMKQVGCG